MTDPEADIAVAVAQLEALRAAGWDVAAIQVGCARVEVRGWRDPSPADPIAAEREKLAELAHASRDRAFGLPFPGRSREPDR